MDNIYNNIIYYFILFCRLRMHGKNNGKVEKDSRD